jgi:hypothetical protein
MEEEQLTPGYKLTLERELSLDGLQANCQDP